MQKWKCEWGTTASGFKVSRLAVDTFSIHKPEPNCGKICDRWLYNNRFVVSQIVSCQWVHRQAADKQAALSEYPALTPAKPFCRSVTGRLEDLTGARCACSCCGSGNDTERTEKRKETRQRAPAHFTGRQSDRPQRSRREAGARVSVESLRGSCRKLLPLPYMNRRQLARCALDPEPELMPGHGARLPCSMLFVEIPEQLTGTA